MEQSIRVLYLEDDEDSVEMVTFMLSLSGIDVVAASTSKEAANLAKTENFDLYLLDGLLPCGNSLELCRELREYAPSTPIVFYSALGFQTDVQKGLEAGATAYLVKPYSGDLSQTILKIIGDAKINEKPAGPPEPFPLEEETVLKQSDEVYETHYSRRKESVKRVDTVDIIEFPSVFEKTPGEHFLKSESPYKFPRVRAGRAARGII